MNYIAMLYFLFIIIFVLVLVKKWICHMNPTDVNNMSCQVDNRKRRIADKKRNSEYIKKNYDRELKNIGWRSIS